jgi:hypothetical protein
VNRRAFLLRLGVGGAAVATGVAAASGGVSVAGAAAGRAADGRSAAPTQADPGNDGVELVINGSFEDSAPGTDPASWQQLA